MSEEKSRVTVGLHFTLALYVRKPTHYMELTWHQMDINHSPFPHPLLNKRDSMSHGDLATTLRLWPSFIENQNKFIPGLGSIVLMPRVCDHEF